MRKENIARANLILYNWGAAVYDWITTQDYWTRSVQKLAEILCPHTQRLRILDLGCGAGVSTFAIAQFFKEGEVTGIDIAHKMLERAELHQRVEYPHLTNIRFVEADATSLPFDTGSFDIAIGHSFLYLIPEKLAVLREVNRVLKPGGQIILMEPYAQGSLWRTLIRRSDYWVKLLRKPGATCRFIASIVAWRIYSWFKGQLSASFVQRIFTKAGFQGISIVPTLDQLGVFCIGFV